MMTDETLKEVIQASASLLTKAVNDLIYVDSHRWSTRPCPTCNAITALIGEPFGCDRKRKEQ